MKRRKRPPLETFIELEAQFEKIAAERCAAGLRRTLRGAGEEDDKLQNVQMPLLRGGDLTRLTVIGLACLQFGAALVDPDDGDRWLERGADLTPLQGMLRHWGQLEQRVYPKSIGEAVSNSIQRQAVADADAVLIQKAEPRSSRSAAVRRARTISGLTANLATSRLVNFGALDAMMQRSILRYRIQATLDSRTTQICRHMHGRTFIVEEGYQRLSAALTTDDVEDLRVVHPWIPANRVDQLRGMSSQDLEVEGWNVPPYHPRCRSVVIAEEETYYDDGDDLALADENEYFNEAMIAALVGSILN